MNDPGETVAADPIAQLKIVSLAFGLPGDLRSRYEAIASDPLLKHFVRIPRRILRCLDRYGIACHHNEAHERLKSLYLFIGVADEAIDSGQLGIGDLVLAQLSNRTSVPAQHNSRVSVTTEILRHHVRGNRQFLDTLRELHQAVMHERVADTIQDYLQSRRAVGSLTAELTYILIRSSMDREHEVFRLLLKDVGAVGCLVDSMIDLGLDSRSGLLGFRPGATDYVRLAVATIREGLSLVIQHPRVLDLFAQAVVDNVLDRVLRNGSHEMVEAVSRRRNEAAGVV